MHPIQGDELPGAWIEKFKLPVGQRFTITIKSDTTEELPPEPSPEKRRQLLKCLEGTNGEEDSNLWINEMKSNRTISEPKVHLT
ncbi:MAG: hypothetical protein HQL06_13230 [Nitrospirae bacterium]|nr:hypothetical protein [Nitrospirota bacterium]